MTNSVVFSTPDWEKFKNEVLQELAKLGTKKEKRFLKSTETRKMLGGISAAKLQTLRVGGHLPAINADGLWLYDVEDIVKFTNRNKINA
jgi:hypothetical protein